MKFASAVINSLNNHFKISQQHQKEVISFHAGICLNQKNRIYYNNDNGKWRQDPENAEDFEILQIKKHAAKLQWFLLKDPDITEYIQCSILDGQKKKHSIQIFSPILQYRLKNKSACSCAQFIEHGLNYCYHIAALENALCNNHYLTYTAEMLTYHRWPKSKSKKTQKTWNYFEHYNSLSAENVRVYSPYLTSNQVSVAKSPPSIMVEAPKVASYDLNPIPDIKLFDYQQNALQFIMDKQRAVLSIPMGLGKTMIALGAIANIIKTNSAIKILIICPKSLKRQWAKEALTRLGINSVDLDKDLAMDKFLSQNINIGLITYQLYARKANILTKFAYDVVIADEIQYCRNAMTKIAVAMRKLKTQYFWGLSGTVIENSLDDLYSIIQITDPSILGQQWKFNAEHKKLLSITKHKINYSRDIIDLDGLKKKISSRVFTFMPEVSSPIAKHIHRVDMTPEMKSIHDSYWAEARVLQAMGTTRELSFFEKALLQSLLLKTRQAANSLALITKKPEPPSPKLIAIKNIVNDICVIRNEKMVIYSQWTEMLELIEKEISSLGVMCWRFDGSMTAANRQKAIDEFINSKMPVVFTSSDAGGLGIDGLQFASNHILHAELPYNPARLDQRNGRLARLGQKLETQAFYIITNNSIEEQISGTLNDKSKIRENVLG